MEKENGTILAGSFSAGLRVVSLTLMFAFIIMTWPVKADAWWDGKWQQRRRVQFDTSAKGADIKDNLTDAPVLVRLHSGNFSFASAKPDGADLRFVGPDDKSPLKYHIEKFDPKQEMALVWVKVPRVTADSAQDFIWMYYGNSAAADGQDPGGTYDVNQVAVYHLGEKDGNPRDATSYGNHAASFSGKLGLPSVVGNGSQLAGPGELMTVPRSTSLNFTKGFTFSSWIRVNQSEGTTHFFSWDDDKQSIIIGIEDSKVYCSLGTGKGQTVVTPKTAVLTPKGWHHLAVTVEPDKQITVYLDGKEDSSIKLKGAVPAPAADIIIGASAKGSNVFSGDVDEVQLSNVARTAGWIQAAFQGQGPDGKMTSYMTEEKGGGGGESLTIHLMKNIIKTIPLDGWIIIGLLFVLGCGSVYVFWQKFTLLNAAGKSNETFSRSFKNIENPLELYDKEEEFRGSPLYDVYRSGCEELGIWIEKKGNAMREGGGLSQNVINSFKAALEKESMYVSRRFSAGMVVMNMSVAGGPFMGLLGTVWGVMNTFAGLAEAGEASLSAIAPGVASALACTMAGLVIAIPALFASSYITGRIKNINADVIVFMDEFILKLEEHGEQAP